MGRMAGRPMVDGWPVASRQSPVASSGTQTQDPGRESGRGVWVSPCEDGRYGTKCVCGMGGLALAGEEQEETAVLSWWWWFWWFCGLERREWLGGWVDGSGGWTGGGEVGDERLGNQRRHPEGDWKPWKPWKQATSHSARPAAAPGDNTLPTWTGGVGRGDGGANCGSWLAGRPMANGKSWAAGRCAWCVCLPTGV